MAQDAAEAVGAHGEVPQTCGGCLRGSAFLDISAPLLRGELADGAPHHRRCRPTGGTRPHAGCSLVEGVRGLRGTLGQEGAPQSTPRITQGAVSFSRVTCAGLDALRPVLSVLRCCDPGRSTPWPSLRFASAARLSSFLCLAISAPRAGDIWRHGCRAVTTTVPSGKQRGAGCATWRCLNCGLCAEFPLKERAVAVGESCADLVGHQHFSTS